MRNKRNKSHCSVFSCVSEYRHIQGWIPILMPSGKASCGNSSDEAVETQSFNLWFIASEYTHERMTLAMAVKQQHKTRLHSANLSRQDYIFFIYVQSIDTAPCDFLSSDSSEVSHTLVRCVTFHQLWRGRRVSCEHWFICFSNLMISVSRVTYRRKAMGEKTTQPYISYLDPQNPGYLTNK